MIFEIIYHAALFIVVLLSCVFMHETGHKTMLNKFGYKYTHKFVKGLKFEISCDDPRITRDQDRRVLFFGIFLGVFPILLLGFFEYNLITVVCLFIIYLIFCLDDFKRLKELRKQ